MKENKKTIKKSNDRWRLITLAEAASERGPQDQLLFPVVNTALAGSRQLSTGMVFMPPSKVSRLHLHEDHEIIIVVLEGYAATLMGPQLEPLVHGPGDFVFIPKGVEHVAINLSQETRVVALEARSDPDFNSDVVVLPGKEKRIAKIANTLRRRFVAGKLAFQSKQLTSDATYFDRTIFA